MADDTSNPIDPTTPEPWNLWRGRIAASRRRRDDASSGWQENVRRRSGRSSETDAAPTKVSVNKDWPLTKAKIALLYSQTPQVRLTSNNPKVAGPLSVFSARLNKKLQQESIGSAIEEELADVVNAAGISGLITACEKRTEMRDMPLVDPSTLPPEMQQAIQQGMVDVPTMPVQAVTDVAYPLRRLSPTSLLIPADFTGSNYDQARWLGYEGSLTWEQAQSSLGLTIDQKDDVIGPDRRASGSWTSLNNDTTKFRDQEVVNFQELYYWRHYYHVEETSFFALQRLVFVDGIDTPVIDEAYQGQKRQQDGTIIGVRKNPIQILTLTYISDDCLPPSDSTISRHQVNELEDSRDSMVLQRKHSIPIRWYDTNRVSPGTRSLIEKGTYQGLIPISGPGDRALGEVARSAFPPERFEFDRIINSDITDQWQVGTNQTGNFASGERSAREAGIVEKNFQTRIGQERAKVERHFIAVSEILAGLMTLHGNAELPPEALADVMFTLRVDSTVLLDAQARIDQLMRFLNMTAQSGFINPKPVIEEIAELSGLDPQRVVVDPKPKPPEPINVSVGGPEDVNDPLFLALLMRTEQGPRPQDLQAAMKLIEERARATAKLLVPGLPGDQVTPGQPPPGQGPQGESAPQPNFPGWETASRIERRSEDGGA